MVNQQKGSGIQLLRWTVKVNECNYMTGFKKGALNTNDDEITGIRNNKWPGSDSGKTGITS